MLSWGAELAQLDIPQALAIAFLAVIAVLPEYAVDMYFAWQAGKDPAYVSYATANVTGSNRLLIGVGWATVVIAFWLKSGLREIPLLKEQRLYTPHPYGARLRLPRTRFVHGLDRS